MSTKKEMVLDTLMSGVNKTIEDQMQNSPLIAISDISVIVKQAITEAYEMGEHAAPKPKRIRKLKSERIAEQYAQYQAQELLEKRQEQLKDYRKEILIITSVLLKLEPTPMEKEMMEKNYVHYATYITNRAGMIVDSVNTDITIYPEPDENNFDFPKQ